MVFGKLKLTLLKKKVARAENLRKKRKTQRNKILNEKIKLEEETKILEARLKKSKKIKLTSKQKLFLKNKQKNLILKKKKNNEQIKQFKEGAKLLTREIIGGFARLGQRLEEIGDNYEDTIKKSKPKKKRCKLK